MVEPVGGYPLLRGVAYAVVGVGFWVGGLLFFNWLWKRLRNDSES